MVERLILLQPLLRDNMLPNDRSRKPRGSLCKHRHYRDFGLSSAKLPTVNCVSRYSHQQEVEGSIRGEDLEL